MELFFSGLLRESSSSKSFFANQDIQKCPFLRNVSEPTNFSFLSATFPDTPRATKGPIFEDGPNFDTAFKLFHGPDGVIPLSGKSYSQNETMGPENETMGPEPAPYFNPLAANAASISLSGFGPGGPFSFDSLNNKWKKFNKKSSKQDPSQKGGNSSSHEAVGNEWLETGQCPIAKSYRAVNHVLPLVAKALQPPAGMKFHCPPAVVAARAAISRTALAKNLRPQPLPAKILAIAALGMAANVPLGIWREHTEKFSPQWFVAVHAAVPFIAMLRKSILMPKAAMAFTIAASILGQTIGSRAERLRLRSATALGVAGAVDGSGASKGAKCLKQRVNCGGEVKSSSDVVIVVAKPSTTVCF